MFIRARTLRDAAGAPRGAVAAAIDVTERERAAAALRQSEDALRRLTETLEARVAERTDELAAANRQLLAQIEERERVQATLHQMQRLEAVGQLTSGVAHDFNNLLTVVLGNIAVPRTQRRRADAAPARPDARRRRAGRHSHRATARLLAAAEARTQAGRSQRGGRRHGRADALHPRRHGAAGDGAQPDLWPALVDPTQLELVILNLAINARDAMPTGGSLTVTTANVFSGAALAPEGVGRGRRRATT